jgi:uncharacterized membrane protein YkoI
MKLNRKAVTILVLVGLFVGSLVAGAAFSGKPGSAAAAPAQQTVPLKTPVEREGDTLQEPPLNGSIPVDEAPTEGLNDADEAAILQEQAVLSADEAKAAAEAAQPGTKAVKVELESEDGFLVYDVELDNGMELTIDAGDGTVLLTEQEDPPLKGSLPVDEALTEGLSDADEAAILQEQAVLSANEAKTAAEAAQPGTKAIKVELESEDGFLVYDVELDNGMELTIDAGDGTVLLTEQEE